MLTFNDLKRNLKKDTTNLRELRFAILSDSASQLLTQAIKGYGIELGYYINTFEADYNQIERQVFDGNSELYEFKPEIIFINISSEHYLCEFAKLDSTGKCLFSKKKLTFLSELIETINSRLECKIILNNFIEIQDSLFGNFASKIESSFVFQLRSLNFHLAEWVQKIPNLFICDFLALQSTYGYNFIFDPKLYITSDMVYSLDFLPLIAKQVLDIVKAIVGDIKKCLILDLDNTTWGGIIGDDGISQIHVGSLGIGKAFSQLQLWAKQLKERGIILCICSKNTLEIAQEPFEKHPEMVLRLEDISVFVANWENKVDNIRYIKSVLNIGFDSMVFLDDNPFEREMVKNGIPGLTVPELPEDPSEYIGYLRTLNLFETISFTAEDSNRTKQYQEEAKRAQLQNSFTNEFEFLKNLEMNSLVSEFTNFNIPRIAQLSQRSNQFNLRTIRYTEDELIKLTKSDVYFSFSFNLTDRFGDHGLIAAVILKKVDEGSLFIDTWIMSCRVLKRGMENFTLNKIVELGKKLGVGKIIGEYIPTKKNQIVADHYEKLGFEKDEELWVLSIEKFVEKETYIK